MKHLLYLFVCFSLTITAQEIIICDYLTKVPIENVAVFNSEKGVVSNVNGICDISLLTKRDSLTIKHVGYKTKKIAVKDIPEIIFLTQQTTVLPVINFNRNPKIFALASSPLIKNKMSLFDLEKHSASSLLESVSSVTVQKSQAGGGSPNFRGMEANRLLISIDGVVLNNTIFRSGHAQSSSFINPFFINSVKIFSGPGAIAFGDGAMGSALIFETIDPYIKNERKNHLHQAYESSSNAVILNYKTLYSLKNIVFATGFGIQSFGDLKMGGYRKHNYSEWGSDTNYTYNNRQLYTSYNKMNFLHKIRFPINKKTDFLYNTQYSISSNINRFDKLNDINSLGEQKYKEWYYGNQPRLFQSLKIKHISPKILSDYIHFLFAFQDVSESRHHLKSNETLKSNRFERLYIYDINIDLKKDLFKNSLSYGFGSRTQKLSSTANKESHSGELTYNSTRYPDGGSNIKNLYLYSQFNFIVSKKTTLLFGGRYNYNELTALFNDTATYHFPFYEIVNTNTSFITSASINYRPKQNILIGSSFYSGFRNPNIDDIGKVFSKNDVFVVIPNPNLSAEKSQNIEFFFNAEFYEKINVRFEYFNTYLKNAIQRENASLNGDTMLYYDGELMRIQMNQNIESAKIHGIHVVFKYNPTNKILISLNSNLIKGYTNQRLPLAHIPPFNSTTSFEYFLKKSSVNLSCIYNDWKHADEYDLGGIDNLDEATIDGNPSWYTLNLYYNVRFDESISLNFGVQNIFDTHYKTFSSGISSSGRNFTLSLHNKF